MSAGASHRTAAGFTLVEILVVLALLSTVMLALGSALRTMAQTEQRVDERLARADEMRVATGFLKTVLGRVSLRRIAPPGPPGSPMHLFAAAPDSVAWVGIMPARHGVGGRHYFRLAVEPVDGRPSLVLRFAPVTERPDFPDWASAEARALVHDVSALALRYEDAAVQPAVWSAQWAPLERMPARVALQLTARGTVWPEMVIALRPLPSSEAGIGGFVIGGTR